jgi:hypothetical protein
MTVYMAFLKADGIEHYVTYGNVVGIEKENQRVTLSFKVCPPALKATISFGNVVFVKAKGE